jgi:cystathionine beta-synthase
MQSVSRAKGTAMMKGALKDVLEAVGNTPIVKLNSVGAHVAADVFCKLEYLNPGGSMKDRVAINIVRDYERRGLLRSGSTIVEATSGNTGMGLALVAALRGYKCIFVMPDKQSEEKIKALQAFGARVVVCPTAVDPEDPRSYYSVSRRLAEETPGAVLANQYYNPANPEAHYLSTGPEIWAQTGGEIDVFCAGMGTGGTLSGCGKYFKEKKPDIKIVGVDPIGSLYYDYVKTGTLVKPRPYKVEGIGEDFLPGTMNLGIIDEVVRVNDKECFITTRELVRREGIYCGGSGGAAVAGAIKYAEAVGKKMNIVVLLPDSAQKYLSKIFDDNWMRQNGFLDPDPIGTVADLLAAKSPGAVITVDAADKVREVITKMKAHNISQVPVVRDGKVVGVVAEVDVLRHMVEAGHGPDDTVEKLAQADFATVTPATRIALVTELFGQGGILIVLEGQRIVGVVTKIDVIDYLAKRIPEQRH